MRPKAKGADEDEENQDIEDMLLQEELNGEGQDHNEEKSKKHQSKEIVIQ